MDAGRFGIAWIAARRMQKLLINLRHWNFFLAHSGNVWNLYPTADLNSLCYTIIYSPVLRFSRCVDMLHSAQKTIHLQNLTLRFTLTISKLAQALYLYADHILWLSRSGMVKTIDSKKWSDRANKYWIVSIVMNLCRDFYEFSRLFNDSLVFRNSFQKSLNRWNSREGGGQSSQCVYSYVCCNRAVFIDTTKNICDLFIPLTALGYTDLKPRTIGVLGVVSSMAAIIVLLQPTAKLLPWILT